MLFFLAFGALVRLVCVLVLLFPFPARLTVNVLGFVLPAWLRVVHQKYVWLERLDLGPAVQRAHVWP